MLDAIAQISVTFKLHLFCRARQKTKDTKNPDCGYFKLHIVLRLLLLPLLELILIQSTGSFLFIIFHLSIVKNETE